MAEEKNFENRIKKFLREQGWVVYKFHADAMTQAGVPDLLCCSSPGGNFVAIEVKASNGRPSPLQLYNIDLINQAGGKAILLYPKGWDDFKRNVLEGKL